jgi:hypothetical protein
MMREILLWRGGLLPIRKACNARTIGTYPSEAKPLTLGSTFRWPIGQILDWLLLFFLGGFAL